MLHIFNSKNVYYGYKYLKYNRPENFILLNLYHLNAYNMYSYSINY